ncbi:hypothetical protein EMPS_10996 [Entomortierella parvispora]|uniref:Methyltransferase domain-containing protein n=1 Tax=Entomortierella parvispora TaxID=205924 RepID=A0A9P3M1W3_9FUNG|nr:hypothetical protein EMPS_10996 [Entomortierella parvispora]
MAPLRALLSSRAVLVSLVILICLTLLFSTFDASESSITFRKNAANSNLDEKPLIHWEDTIQSMKDAQPLSEYPHRRPRTVQFLLEKARGYYDRVVRQRHELLNLNGFGTDRFRPWNPSGLMYWWWYFPASFMCPHDIQRVGPLADGGKWICGMSFYEENPRAKCVIYSFGINHETRFEGEMLERTDCEIWAYDASVDAMGPEARGPRSHFFPYFIGKTDHVDEDGKQWRTLKSLMKDNGHDWIDILKVDIEGSEYPTFDAIMDDFDVLPFSQLQMELHVDKVSFKDFTTWWERLESKGIYPWWTELNPYPTFLREAPWASEYCFINVNGGRKNILIQNYE